MAVVLLLSLLPALVQAQHGGLNKPPMYAAVPDTSFNCANHMAGYYADMETGCQAYHMCDTLGKQYSYLCPNMTVFNQRFMVCDHWHYVNCSNSDQYYDRNARMAGGGKKTMMPGRRGSFPLDNISGNDIDVLDTRKITQLPITHKEIVMKKIKNQLLNQDRKATSPGTTAKRPPTTQLRTLSQTRTTTTQRKPTRFSTSPLTTTRQPLRHLSGGSSSTTLSRTTQSQTQRPPTTISTLIRRVTPRSSEHRSTTSSSSFTFGRTSSAVTPAPDLFPLTATRSETGSSVARLSTTRKPPTFSTQAPPKISPFARTSNQPFQFPVTQIQHFSQLNNHTQDKSTPVIKMLPGMVARGSGPRFGFGFTNLVRPGSGHASIPQDPENHPLVLEISRQLLLPKLPLSQGTIQGSERKANTDDSREITIGDLTRSSSPENASPFRFNVINPPNGRGGVSFPIEPIILNHNHSHSHIGGPGGQQEDITVLEAKKNGRNRSSLQDKFRRPSLSNNQAFFIPETHLVPPDDILLDDLAHNSSSLTSNEIEESFSLPHEDDSTTHSGEHHHSDHMTMIFPSAKTVNFTQKFSGLVVNPNCPECHPAFLTPGKCTPCVRIR